MYILKKKKNSRAPPPQLIGYKTQHIASRPTAKDVSVQTKKDTCPPCKIPFPDARLLELLLMHLPPTLFSPPFSTL